MKSKDYSIVLAEIQNELWEAAGRPRAGSDTQITQDKQVSGDAGSLQGCPVASTGQAHFQNRNKELLKYEIFFKILTLMPYLHPMIPYSTVKAEFIFQR